MLTTTLQLPQTPLFSRFQLTSDGNERTRQAGAAVRPALELGAWVRVSRAPGDSGGPSWDAYCGGGGEAGALGGSRGGGRRERPGRETIEKIEEWEE